MLFNVYYMNFSKVYEIKMMLSNIIKTDATVENEAGKSSEAELHAKMGTKFLRVFDSEVKADLQSGNNDSRKVLENFKIITTKSLILCDVMDSCSVVSSFDESSLEGQLVRIDNVSLSLENEAELRTVKMFSNGTFKGMKIQEAGGVDVNNLFNSIFKDYAYKITGVISGSSQKIVIKIPLTFESEFENLYSVDDLFIGNVSIIGIYKGKTKIHDLKNSFEFLQGLGNRDDAEGEIHNSQYSKPSTTVKDDKDDSDYNYIDLLAIVQVIKSK